MQVYLFGGAICSWKQATGDEVLFVRPDAVFDKSKPISGGLPHCFPQFGPGAMQQHGFARNLDWEVRAGDETRTSSEAAAGAPALAVLQHLSSHISSTALARWQMNCCVAASLVCRQVQKP
eukprot:GHUV01049289.1.p1 GENE.GHUV01049289.1~~GHUV01049289.1.p1  ORF type:complete len:121 (-),score=52.41 GHUV01049289.1:198-560(-)